MGWGLGWDGMGWDYVISYVGLCFIEWIFIVCFKVRAEVVALKTNTQDKNIPRSVINQIDDKMTATHNIPHRLAVL